VKVVVTLMYVLLYCIDRFLWVVDLFSSEQSGPSTVDRIVLFIRSESLAGLTTPITLIRRMITNTSHLIDEQLIKEPLNTHLVGPTSFTTDRQ